MNTGAVLNSIQAHRDFYANFIVKSAGSSDARLIDAFASVERERFLGPGPWPVFVGSGYLPTISDDPRLVYQDVLIGIATERWINNGEPSLHAACLADCAPQDGETVVHIGAGVGYYTAVLAKLVGPAGHVVAYEIESDLAERARIHLGDLSNVKVVEGSAATTALPEADLIYVNAGATRPLASWLDALQVRGRLIFPLTPNEGHGCMLLVTRLAGDRYAASAPRRAAFIPCIGARDETESDALAAALQTRPLKAVRSLHRDAAPDATAWCVGTDWWLSSAAPE